MFKLSKSRFSTVVSEGSSRLSSVKSMELARDNTEPTQRQCHELQKQILDMWRRIWLGLYQVYDSHGPYHVDRLTQLYLGAGMAVSDLVNKSEDSSGRHKRGNGTLGLLGCALSSQGISRLRLFEGLSVESLKKVIQLLESYKYEVAALGEVYELLRSLQVGLRETTDHDEKAVSEHYPPLADPLARRLIHLDARLDVLVADLEDEHLESFGDSTDRNGWLVKDKVLPCRSSTSTKHLL